ncbi:flippase [Chloroflexota bacterium]
MNFANRVLGTFGTYVLTFVLTIPISIVIARSLGPEGKGIFTLVMLIPALLVTLSNLGIGASNNYYSASGKYKPSALVGNSFVLAGVIGVLALVAFILFWRFSPFDLLAEVRPRYIYVALAVVPLYLLNSYLLGILSGKLKIKQINTVGILNKLVNLLGVIVILLALKQGVLWLILLMIAIQVITSMLYVIILRGVTRYSISFDSKVFKSTVGYGVKAQVANTSSFLHFRVDQYMVGQFVGITQLGYYSIAVGLAELLLFIPRVVNSILFPTIASSTKGYSDKLTTRLSRYTVLTSLIFCLVFAIGANIVIRAAYGQQFLPSVTPFLILLPGLFFVTLTINLSTYISGIGRVIFNTYGSMGALAVNIALNLVLIPRMGIAGAALATTISYSLESIYTTVVFLHLSKKSLSETYIPKWQDLVYLWGLSVRYLKAGCEFINQRLVNLKRLR